MTNSKITFTLDADGADQRLDRLLALRLDGVSLRAARRLVERGRVLVDGRTRPAGYRPRVGQRVEVSDRADPYHGPAPRLVVVREDFAAFFKPAGLNTQAQAGSALPSLEALLPTLTDRPVILVNRLDRDTSGLVLGAFSSQGVARFRALECAGGVEKRYLALAVGHIDRPLTLTAALDTAGKATVRVLARDNPDPLRHTLVQPLARVGELTLVLATIARGARHQIRAHLAGAGHPLAGDALYGGPDRPSGLGLHHVAVRFAGFFARVDPDWPELQVKLEL
ncbi:hypothetical protein JCM15519_32840 [Fundidesulfovibrio butyratiphilus]